MIARSYPEQGRLRRATVTDQLAGTAALVVGALGLALAFRFEQQPLLALLPFVALGLGSLLWRVPIFSSLLLLFMALMVEYYPLGFADATTERLGLWNNLSTLGLSGVPVSPAELLMVTATAFWILRSILTQKLRFRGSPLFHAYAIYLLGCGLGLLHGLMTGGSLTIALWEIRGQAYGSIVFFLVLNTFQSRRQIELVTWGILLGTGLKGVQGTWRYFVTLGGNYAGEGIFDHDEAFFFPSYYLFVLLLFVFGGTRWQKRIGVLLLPCVMVAEVANRRRSSTGALLIALVALCLILFVVLRQQRAKLLAATLLALALGGLYAGAFWNSTAKYAQPIRAIKSVITPDERDASSNHYREQEDFNLMYAIRRDPLLGRGYGVAMENVARMWNLEAVDPFILYRPHNSILWVWWRIGLVGAVLFWIAMGQAMIRHCFIARATTDPYLRRWAIFSVCIMVIFLMISWWDMGQFRYRVVVFVWMILAIVEVLARADTTIPPPAAPSGART